MSGGALLSTSVRPSLSLVLMATLFIAAGVTHFVVPSAYARIVPAWVPAPLAMVYLSGVAEVLGGIGVLVPSVRVAAGWGLILLLVAVFPANVQMLQSAWDAHAARPWIALLALRLPLQPLLVYWVWTSAVRRQP